MKNMLLFLAFLYTFQGHAQNVVFSVTNPSPFASQDKRMHFVTGALGGAWATVIAKDFFHAKHPWIYGVLVGVISGFAKEVYDRRHGGKAEIADGLNTAVGASLAGITISVRF